MIFFLKGLLFLPHILLLGVSKNKLIVREDANNTIRPLGLSYTGTKAVLWLLENDRYFRTMFYQRIGTLSNLVSWYAPGDRTFMPCCPAVGGGHLFGSSICYNIERQINWKKFHCASMYNNRK